MSGGPPWGAPTSGLTSGPRMAPMSGMRSGEKSMTVKAAASSSPTRCCYLIMLRLSLSNTVLHGSALGECQMACGICESGVASL